MPYQLGCHLDSSHFKSRFTAFPNQLQSTFNANLLIKSAIINLKFIQNEFKNNIWIFLQVFEYGLRSDDELFHVELYQWLMGEQHHDQLLNIRSPYLEDFIIR